MPILKDIDLIMAEKKMNNTLSFLYLNLYIPNLKILRAELWFSHNNIP